jgi:RNA polymerase sigma factor (sigma-70 family)
MATVKKKDIPLTAAQQSLVAANHRLVLYWMGRLAPWRDREAAWDAGLDSLIRASRCWRQGRGANFCSYASMAIRRELWTAKGAQERRDRRGRVIHLGDHGQRLEAPAFDPGRREEQERLERAIQRLPDHQRQIIRMRRSGMSVKEIRVIVGRTGQAVRLAQHAGLQRIRREMAA